MGQCASAPLPVAIPEAGRGSKPSVPDSIRKVQTTPSSLQGLPCDASECKALLKPTRAPRASRSEGALGIFEGRKTGGEQGYGDECQELLRAGAEAVPTLLTICSSEGLQVLYQNCASLGYAGDLRSTQELSDSDSSYLMQLLSLQPPEMVEEVMQAIRKDDGPWVRVMQVPPHLGHRAGKPFILPTSQGGLVSFEHPSTTTWPIMTAPQVKELTDTTSSVVISGEGNVLGTAKSCPHKPPGPASRPQNAPFSSKSTPHPDRDDETQIAPSNVYSTLDGAASLPSPRGLPRNRRGSSSWLEQQLEPQDEEHLSAKSLGRCGIVPEDALDAFGGTLEPSSQDRRLVGGSKSFGAQVVPNPRHTSTTRNRLQHLLRKRSIGDSASSFWSNPNNPGADSLYSQAPSQNHHSANSYGQAPALGMQEFMEKAQASGTGTDPSRSRGHPSDPSRGYPSGAGWPAGPAWPAGHSSVTEEHKCWHEITFTPFKNPKTGQKVFMVSQMDVTQRCQMEQRLMQLTEAQLHMLENMFPRHILERILQATNADNNTRPTSSPQSRMSEAHTSGSVLSKEISHTTTFHDCVTIMFTDIVGFTTMSESVQPQEVMAFLNELFSEFDELVAKHKVSKVETAGDCFIICAGILEEDEDGFMALAGNQSVSHARAAKRALNFAAEMMHVAQRFTMPNGQPVRQRVGIHSGPVASGLIGNLLPKFSLFGDTMNTASRMESTSIPGRIQVSEATHALLKDAPECWECTGGVEVKGKGRMVTYLLTEAAMLKPFALGPTGNCYAQLLETSMEALAFVRASTDYGGRGGRQSIDFGGRGVRASIDLGGGGGRPSIDLAGRPPGMINFSKLKSFNRMPSGRKSFSMNRYDSGLAWPGCSTAESPSDAPGVAAPGPAPPHRLSMVATAQFQTLTEAMSSLHRQNLPIMSPHARSMVDTMVGAGQHLGLLLETLRSVGDEDEQLSTISSVGRHPMEGECSGPLPRLTLTQGSGILSRLAHSAATLSRLTLGPHSGNLSTPAFRGPVDDAAGHDDAALVQIT